MLVYDNDDANAKWHPSWWPPILFTFLALALMLSNLSAKPVPKTKPVDPPAPVVDLAGTCVFGDVVQSGRNLTIVGEHWSATGRVRRSEMVELRWTNLADGKIGLGLYKTVDGGLTGSWGWEEDCTYSDDDICGQIWTEKFVIERAK